MEYDLIKIYDGIYHFKFKHKYDLILSFLRMQEYYESNIECIKGNLFSLDEFIAKYCESNKANDFDYFEKYSAFNLPDISVNEFINTYKNEALSAREFEIISKMKEIMKDSKDNYFIGTYKNKLEKDDINHEFCHAIYYTNSNYRNDVDRLLKSNSKLVLQLKKELGKNGYDKTVLNDEANAYLAIESTRTIKEVFPDLPKYFKVPDEFSELFKKYSRVINEN